MGILLVTLGEEEVVLSVEESRLRSGEIFKSDWVGNIKGWVECGELLDWVGANLLLRSP